MVDNNANNRIAKNTIFLYFRSGIILLINLFTVRVVINTLGVDDYGIYSLVGGIVTMFSIIGTTLSSATQRFIMYAIGKNDKKNLNMVFSTCVSLHIVLALILLVILEFVGVWMIENKLNIPINRLNVAHIVYQFSLLTFLSNMIAVPYNASIIAHEKISAFAFISVFESILKLVIALCLLITSIDKLLIYAVLHFAIAAIIQLVYIMYSRKHFSETKQINFKINSTIFKEMFSFSSWNLIGSGAMVLRNQGVDVLLNMFFNIAVNAAKGIAYQVQGAIQLFISNFTTAINPQLTISISKNDTKRANELIFHGGRMSFMMMMIIAVPFMIITEDVLKIWLGDAPTYAVGFVRLTIIMLLCDTLVRLLKNGILANGNIRNFQLIAGLIKLMALPIIALLLRFGFNPYTGFIVNIFIEFICLVPELYFASKLLSFDVKYYLRKGIIPCWISFICAVSISYIFSIYVNFNMIINGVFALLISVVCILLIMNKKELNMLLKFINNLVYK